MPPTISQIERTGPPFYDQEANAVVYPESDGKPMADNTRQFRYIATLKGGFDSYYRDRDDVFVAGDLLWYPVEGDNRTRYAPDVMIAFGRPPGDRGSYLQWRENGQPPNVVFEVLSPGNTKAEMEKKLAAYDRFGVDEYYEYDPDNGKLRGWLRQENGQPLTEIEEMEFWQSPATQVRFHLEGNHLVVTQPDGKVFLTAQEAADALDNATAALTDASEALDKTEKALELERVRADQVSEEARRLADKLKSLGIDPDELD